MSMPEVGAKAPAFTLISSEGAKVSLRDFKGKPVVLYFYPKAMTPGCTQESCDFQSSLAAFKKKKAIVLGVSSDAPDRLAKFKEKYGLAFPLLSDPDQKMQKAYGVWAKKKLYGREYMGTLRSTFLIGADGVIQVVWPSVKVKGHAQDVLDNL